MGEQQTDTKTPSTSAAEQAPTAVGVAPAPQFSPRAQLQVGLQMMRYDAQASLLGFGPVQRQATEAGRVATATSIGADGGGRVAQPRPQRVQRRVQRLPAVQLHAAVLRADAQPPADPTQVPAGPPPLSPTNFTTMEDLKTVLRQERRSLAADAIDVYKTHDTTANDAAILAQFHGDFVGTATQYEAYRREMGLYQHIAELFLNWCATNNVADPNHGPMDRFLAEVQPLHDLSHITLSRSVLDWCVLKIAELPHPVVDIQSADQVSATTPTPNAGKHEFKLNAGPYTFCTVWIDVDPHGKPTGMSEYIYPRAAEAKDPGTGWPLHADLRAPFAWTSVGLQKSLQMLLSTFPTQLRGETHFDAHGDMAEDNLANFQAEYAKAKLEEPASTPARLGALAVSRVSFGLHRMRAGARLEDFDVRITAFDGDKPEEVEVHCWVPINTRTA